MPKLIKVRIKRNQTGGTTRYTYPTEYNAHKINVICYESILAGGYDKVRNREDEHGKKNNHEYCIGVVSDIDAPQFLASPDIVEITRAEADEFFGEELDKKVEKVTDQNAVLSIAAKALRGETLTDEDKKAIDPSDSTPGVGQSRSYNDALKELGF